MKIKMNMVLFYVYCCLNTLPFSAHAISWPEFLPPDKKLLSDLNLIDSSQCLNGQGKITSNTVINIQQHRCKTFCPNSWAWVIHSDEKCHNLNDYVFKKYEVAHYDDKNSTTNYSMITAFFGPEDNPILKMTMTTAVTEHWYCYEIDTDKHLIVCANDI